MILKFRLPLAASIIWAVTGSCLISSLSVEAAGRPNVLFLAVDDLRPQLGCYGHEFMKTPNIDRLAGRGMVFERAYCMVPVCGASRASLMTGLRPTRDRFVDHRARADHGAPDVTTLNTHFKTHGYVTISVGKVLHQPDDSEAGWTRPQWRPPKTDFGYQDPGNIDLQRRLRDARSNPLYARPFEAADSPDSAYPDAEIADRAVKDLQELADRDDPWFLAVGFLRPHLPFTCPQRYWDLYDESEVRLPENYEPPSGVPRQALEHTFHELRTYTGVPESGPVSEEMARRLVRGYFACVSFVDAQIGRVLDELGRLGLRENTIVVLWGDHGWQLGEHGTWCKHSCFETSMQVPLIVTAPTANGPGAGSRSMGLIESIDIYPTLCDLAGIPKPGHLQGDSFVPLMADPARAWKRAAIGRYADGDTIRTDRYRFTRFSGFFGWFTAGRMLFDHRHDPGENRNIAQLDTHDGLIDELTEQLRSLEVGPD